VTATVSGRLGAYVTLGGTGLLAGLLLGRPEPVALALPFILAVAVGLALAGQPDLDLRVRLDRDRVIEGEEVELLVEVYARRPAARLEFELRLPRNLEAKPRGSLARTGLATDSTRTYRWALTPRRWGGRPPVRVRLRARDPLGFFTYAMEERELPPLRVYPRPEAVRRLLRPAETQVFSGNEVSRLRGDGIEFADVRPFVPGDRVRRINWRVSARRGDLHVNEMRPERNADVVVFVDTFSDVGDDVTAPAGSTLDLAVRAAAALAAAYLQRRDRVGLIGFGGTLRWLRPEMGERQLYRVADALLDTEARFSYAWKGLEVIPRQTLPPKSLVVALTPLLDGRSVTALLDLRGRGHDLSVITVSPVPFVRPGGRASEQLAYRLWEMEREALRSRFLALGVPVVPWRRGEPLEAVLAASAAFRREARLARA
jgi:uncharacterized protein (DUF58 family)